MSVCCPLYPPFPGSCLCIAKRIFRLWFAFTCCLELLFQENLCSVYLSSYNFTFLSSCELAFEQTITYLCRYRHCGVKKSSKKTAYALMSFKSFSQQVISPSLITMGLFTKCMSRHYQFIFLTDALYRQIKIIQHLYIGTYCTLESINKSFV